MHNVWVGRPAGSRIYSRLQLQRQNLEKWLKMSSILRSEVAHQSTRATSDWRFGHFWTFKLVSKRNIWFLGQIIIGSERLPAKDITISFQKWQKSLTIYPTYFIHFHIEFTFTSSYVVSSKTKRKWESCQRFAISPDLLWFRQWIEISSSPVFVQFNDTLLIHCTKIPS